LFGVSSGRIKLSNGYGKSNRVSVTVTLSSNTANYTLGTAQIPGYVAGKTDVNLVVNSGVYVYSTNTSNAGLTVAALNATDTVSIVNNGYIIGKGGDGAQAYSTTPGNNTILGGVGGPAMVINRPVTITNNSYIAGGGGGGSAHFYLSAAYGYSEAGGASGGGGAGGGAGGDNSWLGGNGGAGGGPGQAGSNGNQPGFAGAGGGRILPGVGGATALFDLAKGGGAGGGGVHNSISDYNGYYQIFVSSGGGGGWGAAGGGVGNPGNPVGYAYTSPAGQGGSANSAGRSGFTAAIGGGAAGGKAVNLNGYTVTWLANGTRWGAIS
jgi:hypothetical protein